jgi:DNA helicase IV
MAWMINEGQLDPDQKEFINKEPNNSGNVWVQGFAGSGKSILMVYSIKDILRRQSQAKICVVLYTHALIDMFKTGMKEIGLPDLEVITFYEFHDSDKSYDYIFCDEVQDLPARVLKEMKKRAKKVYVAGDSNQSIYDEDPKWRESVVSPDDVEGLLTARVVKLNYIHRLTKSIINAIQKLLPSMNIWGAKRDTTKSDVQIRLGEANTITKEVEYVWKEARKFADVGKTAVILIPTHNSIAQFLDELLAHLGKSPGSYPKNKWGKPDYGKINSQFKDQGVKLQFIGSGYGSLQDAEKNRHIMVMTYHSSKGLDFDNVFIPFANDDLYISKYNSDTLFMVAMTRCKQNLFLTYTGSPHNLVDKFKESCTLIKIGSTAGVVNSSALDF